MSGRERDEAVQQTHGDRPGRRILGRLMIDNPPVWVVEGPRIRDDAVARRVRAGLKEIGRDSEYNDGAAAGS